jgi:host factor-I protein
MNKQQMNLQDNFLNQVRKDSIPVTVYLISGIQLKGYVRGFDSFTVILESPGRTSQLVYKHAMASVVPLRSVYTGPPREEIAEDGTETSEKMSAYEADNTAEDLETTQE